MASMPWSQPFCKGSIRSPPSGHVLRGPDILIVCAVIDDHKPASPDGGDYAVFEPPVITGEEFLESPDEDAEDDLDEHCIECGYDLRGSMESGVCPECGTNVRDSMRAREFSQYRRAQMVVELSGLRWAFYGAIPIVIWAPLALAAYSHGSALLQWLILPSGITIGFGATILGCVQAAEEASETSGIGAAFVVLLSLCAVNLGVIVFVMARVGL